MMGMDLMECFLHAIRLQFMGGVLKFKFFKADGYKFNSFSFFDALTDYNAKNKRER